MDAEEDPVREGEPDCDGDAGVELPGEGEMDTEEDVEDE